MRYYLIAGEASGDLHGSNLMKGLSELDPKAEFRAWGGEKMEAAGAELVMHYRNLAFMGFLEVAKNLGTILGNLKFCKADIAQWKPDVVILIDYPGFNLRIAPFLKKQGIRCVYYISPQLWAWKAGRVKKVKRFVDQMLVILPFEKEFYARYNYEVEFVGHPLLDAIPKIEARVETGNQKILALLPGSRKQEISKMLPIFLKASTHFPEHKVVVAGAPGQEAEFYNRFQSVGKFELRSNQTYALLAEADCAMVTSGTATLETALFEVPQVVCYRGSWASYQIGRRLVKVDFISLVNLIMGRKVVEELIQDELTPNKLQAALKAVAIGEGRAQLLSDYRELKQKLGGKGASSQAAKSIIDAISASGSHQGNT